MVESAELERAIEEVRERIAAACERAGRRVEEIRLIGASKTVPAEVVAAAARAGLTEFGENYVQELQEKRGAAPEAVWHFLGRLQRNKVRRVLELADVVQTLEPGRAADRLVSLAEERRRGLQCLVEVDFTERRVGIAPRDAGRFVERLGTRSGVEVRGLMTVPPLDESPRPYFVRLRDLRDALRHDHPTLQELSMGMSADYEEAVEEGATMVRVGAAIFGPRR